MTLSGATGEATGCSKKKIRPVLLKDRLLFQITAYRGTQVFHENHTAEEAAAILEADLSGSFKQLQIETTSFEATVLVSKKGKMTVRKKQRSVSEDNVKVSLSHNRKKRYILEEGRPVPFLVDLGVQTKEGKVITSRYDKFRQINRFLEFIEDIWPLLPKDRPVHIIDFGCGKSYLTFAMYYYLHELKGLTLEVTGLDLKKDVIVHCNELAKKYHYEGLSFLHGDIADYTGTDSAETVVLLSHKKADSYIHIDVEFGEGEGKIPVDSIAKRAEAYKPKEKVTYKMIKEYIEAKYGFKVHTAYIAEVKRDLGLPMYDAPNAVEELKQPRKHPTPEKVEAIKDALRYFAVI